VEGGIDVKKKRAEWADAAGSILFWNLHFQWWTWCAWRIWICWAHSGKQWWVYYTC